MKIKKLFVSCYGIVEKEQKAVEPEVSVEYFKKCIAFLKGI